MWAGRSPKGRAGSSVGVCSEGPRACRASKGQVERGSSEAGGDPACVEGGWWRDNLWLLVKMKTLDRKGCSPWLQPPGTFPSSLHEQLPWK